MAGVILESGMRKFASRVSPERHDLCFLFYVCKPISLKFKWYIKIIIIIDNLKGNTLLSSSM